MICQELEKLRNRFRKVYEAFPFFNDFYTNEEIKRSLKHIKCDIAYSIDLEANVEIRKEYEELQSKFMMEDLSLEELDRMDELSQYLASTIVKEDHIHSGGCHALWVLNNLLKKWEQDDLLVERLLANSVDTADKLQKFMEFYRIYQQSAITGEDLETQASDTMNLSSEQTAKFRLIINDIFPILFSYLHQTKLNDDVIRVISFILLLEQSLKFARENPSETNMFNKLISLKYKYLKGTIDFHSVIGEVLSIGLLAKSGILREIELSTVHGKRPDAIIEINGESVELEIYSPTTPSFITQVQTIGDKKVRPAFAYSGLAVEDNVIRKIQKKQLSQTRVGFLWIYSAYGFDDLYEYEELFDLIDFGKRSVNSEMVTSIEGSEKINGLIVTDLNNLSDFSSDVIFQTFSTENYDLVMVGPIIKALIELISCTSSTLYKEILEIIGKTSINKIK